MGTRSSLENFNTNRTEFTSRINRPETQSTLVHAIHSAEKALSMNSLNEQNHSWLEKLHQALERVSHPISKHLESSDTHYRNGSVSSTENTTSNSTEGQQPRPQRPRSAPGNQSVDSSTQPRTDGTQLHAPNLEVNGLPETRRMAVCEANDEAETARRRMRVYKKRF